MDLVIYLPFLLAITTLIVLAANRQKVLDVPGPIRYTLLGVGIMLGLSMGCYIGYLVGVMRVIIQSTF